LSGWAGKTTTFLRRFIVQAEIQTKGLQIPVKNCIGSFELLFMKNCLFVTEPIMECKQFREFAKDMVDYIGDYLENIRERYAPHYLCHLHRGP
jgi:hypothetical protein